MTSFIVVVLVAVAIFKWVYRSGEVDAEKGSVAINKVQPRVSEAAFDGVQVPSPAETAGRGTLLAVANAPPQKINFETAPDLYKVATDSINASDPWILFNGQDAVRACRALIKTRDEYEQLAAGSQTSQALAAKELLKRCGGFFDNDFAANSGLLARYRQKLAGNEGQYFHRGSSQKSIEEIFGAVLATQDWQGFSASMSWAMPRTLESVGIPEESEEATLFGVAWLQAVCDMKDCSGNDIYYIKECADWGHCVGSTEAVFSEGLDDRQKNIIKGYRGQITGAVRRKDANFFGMKGP